MTDVTSAEAWWESLTDDERSMWKRFSPRQDSASAYEIYVRDMDAISQARSRGSSAGDRAIGKHRNPYDLHTEPHLRFYWDWLYEVTWAQR